jgi:polysaccharide export outer membrane protein
MNPKQLFRTLLFIVAVVFGLGAGAQTSQPEYQLGNGDNIRIVVFQNPDLTLETRVTENGTISYPLVGTVKIGGMTIPAAEQAIAKALSDGGFIQKPQVNIALVKNLGNQVSVLGWVNRSGRYPLETFNTRVSEMIAIAGGVMTGSVDSPGGADIIILTGTRDGKPFRKEIDIPGMFLDKNLENDIVVAGGDVIYVHHHKMYYIYGEVQRPGFHRLERNMTVRQAIAQSSGPTLRGSERRLKLYRRGADGKIETTTPVLDDLLQPDDVLYVNESFF